MSKLISDMTLDELKAELTRLYGLETIETDKVNEVKKLIAQKEVTKGQLETEIKELQKEQQQAENEGRLDLHAEVTRKLKATEAQLAELKQSEQFEAQEQRVEEGKTQISTAIDELGIEDPNVKELIIIITEDNMRKLQKEHAQVLEDLNEDISSAEGQLREKVSYIEELEYSNEELSRSNTIMDEKNLELITKLKEETEAHEATLKLGRETAERLEEIEQNRKNAVNQLEEKDNEIQRLRSHIEDLQQDLANAPAPKPAIDITPTKEKSELVEAINKKYKSAVPLNNAGLYFEVEDEEGNKEVMPKAEVEELQRKELVMPELGTSFRIDDASREEDTHTDETRIITVDEEAEISEGEQGSNFPSTESQGPDQVGPSDTRTYDMDTTRYATYRELQTVKDEMYRMQRSLDDQFGTTFVKAG